MKHDDYIRLEDQDDQQEETNPKQGQSHKLNTYGTKKKVAQDPTHHILPTWGELDEEEQIKLNKALNEFEYQQEEKKELDKVHTSKEVISTSQILHKEWLRVFAAVFNFTLSVLFFMFTLQSGQSCHWIVQTLGYIYSFSYLVGFVKQAAIIRFNFKVEGEQADEVIQLNFKLRHYNHRVILFHFCLGLVYILAASRIVASGCNCGPLNTLFCVWLYIYNGLYILCPLLILLTVYYDHHASINYFNLVIDFFGVPKLESLKHKQN